MSTGLEVADVFRRHGDAYRRAHDGHLGRVERRVMSGHRAVPDGGAGRAHRGLRRLRPRPLRLQLVPQPALPEVPGAGPRRVARHPTSRTAAGSILPRRVHPAGRRWPRLPPRTRRRSTPSCSEPRPRRCEASRPTRSISAPRSASSPCSTPGAGTCTTIRMSIVSCRVAVPRSTARAGLPVAPGSFCRCASSRGSSAACSSTSCAPRSKPATSAFSETSPSLHSPPLHPPPARTAPGRVGGLCQAAS
jgi:hypothetical protein